MQITDDRPAVVLPDGVSVQPKPKMLPPNAKYFGWIDHVGDENTFAYDEIIGAQRARDGRYFLYVRYVTQPVAIPEGAYYRLLKKFGWQEQSQIARAS